MPTLDPRLILRVAFYCVAGLLIALGVRSLRPSVPAENPAYDALVAALNRKMAGDSVALDSARVALATAHASVTRTVTRYQALRDTLNIHDTLQVIVFRDRADSLKRSCTQLDNSCERLRVRADSVIADVTLDRNRWKLSAESLKPGRFDRVKEWGIRALIGYGAFRAGQAVR